MDSSKFEKQRELVLALLANQESPEESGGQSPTICWGLSINSGPTPSKTFKSCNAGPTRNNAVGSHGATSDRVPLLFEGESLVKNIPSLQ